MYLHLELARYFSRKYIYCGKYIEFILGNVVYVYVYIRKFLRVNLLLHSSVDDKRSTIIRIIVTTQKKILLLRTTTYFIVDTLGCIEFFTRHAKKISMHQRTTEQR